MKNVRADVRRHLIWGIMEDPNNVMYWYKTKKATHKIEKDFRRMCYRCISISNATGEIYAETFLPRELLERGVKNA